MSIFYSDPSKKEKIRQPLFKRQRSYYRSPRKSGKENLVSQQIYTDLQRIYFELEEINTNILQNVKIILDKEQDNDLSEVQEDGSRIVSFDKLNNATPNIQWKSTTNSYQQIHSLLTMDSLSSRIQKIKMKLNRLEN